MLTSAEKIESCCQKEGEENGGDHVGRQSKELLHLFLSSPVGSVVIYPNRNSDWILSSLCGVATPFYGKI